MEKIRFEGLDIIDIYICGIVKFKCLNDIVSSDMQISNKNRGVCQTFQESTWLLLIYKQFVFLI